MDPPTWRAGAAKAAAAAEKRAHSPAKRGRAAEEPGGGTQRDSRLALADSRGSRAGGSELTLKNLEARVDLVS